MNTTINVVCYKSKTLANGENPLMIRLCKDGKRKYKSLGISINPQHWDFEKNTPKRNCQNKELIIKIINENINKYSELLLTLKASDKDFTVNSLIEKVNPVSIRKYTVLELIDIHINQLIQENRLRYALTFKNLKSSLLKYNKHLNIHFSEIDVQWLKNYEMWLRKRNLGDNSIGIIFRTFRETGETVTINHRYQYSPKEENTTVTQVLKPVEVKQQQSYMPFMPSVTGAVAAVA